MRLLLAPLFLAACAAPPKPADAPRSELEHPRSAQPPAATCDPRLSLPTAPSPPTDQPVSVGPARNVGALPVAGASEKTNFSVDSRVTNGSIFERGSFALKPGVKLVVPRGAVVERGAPAGKVEVYVEKTLGYAGHPPERMSPRDLSRNMGLATKSTDAELVLSTLGEWDSHIEGGAYMLLFLRVPEDVEVSSRRMLTGDRSPASTWPEDAFAKGEAGRSGYWYSVVNPAPGWTRVPLAADAKQTVRVANAQHERDDEPAPPPQLTDEQIKASMECTWNTHVKELMACGEEAKGLEGWLELSWETREDGSIKRSDIFVGPLKNTAIEVCVLQRFGQWHFADHMAGSFNRRLIWSPRG